MFLNLIHQYIQFQCFCFIEETPNNSILSTTTETQNKRTTSEDGFTSTEITSSEQPSATTLDQRTSSKINLISMGYVRVLILHLYLIGTLSKHINKRFTIQPNLWLNIMSPTFRWNSKQDNCVYIHQHHIYQKQNDHH